MSKWLIQFRFPENQRPIYAGRTVDGTLGYAPTKRTAERFVSYEAASRTIENAYGLETSGYAYVVKDKS